MMSRPRMVLIGLDCAAPELVFDRYRGVMPNVSALMERGAWGPLRSCEPPITVPAWTCMVSGRDPGELGLYGFRNRVPGSTELRLADAGDVRVKRVWDWLGEHGYRVASLFVPLTSPPSPVRGVMVSGFMHPGGDAPWCFPRALEREIETRFGPYRSDVEDFRSDDLDRVYREVVAMTDQHFGIAEWVWEEQQPDFMMMVEIGVDRFHHAFWCHIDPEHPRYESGNPYEHLGRDYYACLDQHIGRIAALAGDETAIVIVSDHGARAMHGGFCINEWLIRQGYLVLRNAPVSPSSLDHAWVDWSRTTAWAEGGYYARVCLNIRGREPNGIIEPLDAGALRKRLAHELRGLRNELGQIVPTWVRDPAEHYRQARGFPPDLMVYFDDLRLRAIGSIGHGRLVLENNDTGPDTCNHDWNGIFIMAGGNPPSKGPIHHLDLYDLPPIILSHFGTGSPLKKRAFTNS